MLLGAGTAIVGADGDTDFRSFPTTTPGISLIKRHRERLGKRTDRFSLAATAWERLAGGGALGADEGR
jgi:hypothetical protein